MLREKIITDIIATIEDKFVSKHTAANECSSLTMDLGLDSMDSIELIMDLEKQFNITIPDEEAERMKTVGDIANYIEAKMGHVN